ncbi:hypothetical protein LCGC14_1655460 [marine sediment metagenome]|uniref:Uncharacterized protein n=1 Tax=marine sediment metagenome TaxID=412755 RepID=A0A0F9II45_9ZZZZ
MTHIEPTDDQVAAIDEIMSWVLSYPGSDQMELSLSGAAGTGKSTGMACLRAVLEAEYGVFWAAMTGKAARRLQEASGVPATTLHSILYIPPHESPDHVKFETVRRFPGNAGDVVVIDEASMVTPKIRSDLEQWMQEGARILYVGDGYQLPPILSKDEEREYGRDFTIFREVRGPELFDVIRNDDDVLYAATHIREEGEVLLKSRGLYTFRAEPVWSVLDDWHDDPDDHALITWRNKLRMKANKAIRQRLGRVHPLPQTDEPILYCRNGQEVLNGQMAVTDAIVGGGTYGPVEYETFFPRDRPDVPLTVSCGGRYEPMDGGTPSMDDGQWREYRGAMREARTKYRAEHGENPGRLDPIPITWAYCLTAHKAQGSEFRRTSVFLTDWDCNARPMQQMTTLPNGDRMAFALRWVYTALTRAKEQATLVIGRS